MLAEIPFQTSPDHPSVIRAVVTVPEGRTAPNPASTKRPIYGPRTVVYEKRESGGINAHVYADEIQAQADWDGAWLPKAVTA